jgi:hypothetical protein
LSQFLHAGFYSSKVAVGKQPVPASFQVISRLARRRRMIVQPIAKPAAGLPAQPFGSFVDG